MMMDDAIFEFVDTMGKLYRHMKNVLSAKRLTIKGPATTIFADGACDAKLEEIFQFDWFSKEGYEMFLSGRPTWRQQSEVALADALRRLPLALEKIESIDAGLTDTDRENEWWKLVMTDTRKLKGLLLGDRTQCIVCMEQPRSVVCKPCGHCYLCWDCYQSNRPKTCWFCAKPVAYGQDYWDCKLSKTPGDNLVYMSAQCEVDLPVGCLLARLGKLRV
jgi:hypothetical protein